MGKRLVKRKWVYGIKYVVDGIVNKHKVSLVSNELSHIEGDDYNEAFSHVDKVNYILLVLSLAMCY